MTMKRCSKILAWLLTFIMAFNMMPVTGLAADEEVDGYVNIGETEDTVNLTKSDDPLGISGKSGVLAVCVNGQYTAVINSQLPSSKFRRVARNVTVVDGKVICRNGQEPSNWTITKAPDYDNDYYLKNGNQYLTLTEKDGVVMTTTPTAVRASVENGKKKIKKRMVFPVIQLLKAKAQPNLSFFRWKSLIRLS